MNRSCHSAKLPLMRCSLLLGFFLSFPSFFQAQDTLTLKEAMEKAVAHNHRVQVAQNQRKIAENELHIGNAGLLPRVEIRSGGDYSRENTTQEFAGGIPDSEIEGAETRTANASVNLDYTLFDGMSRINEYKKLEAQKGRGELQARSTTEDVLMELVNSYYDLARAQDQYRITRENMELSQKRLNRVQGQNEYGKADKVDVLNAQVDLDSDSSSFMEARSDVQRSKRSLNVLMGRDPDAALAVDGDLELVGDLEKDSLIRAGMKKNARLARAEKDLEVAEFDRKIAGAGNYPELSLNSSYSYSRNQSDAGILNLNESDGLSAGIRLSYPIFQGFQQDIKEKNAQIRLQSRKEELAEVEKKVRRDLLNAWEEYRLRMNMLRMEERNLENARKNFERSQASYELGRIDATRFREAQVNLIQARIRRSNSKYQAKVAEMELLKLAGGMKQRAGIE